MKTFLVRPLWSRADKVAALLAVVCVVWLCTPLIWPASQWYVLRSIHVHDSVAGGNPRVDVDRSMYRSTQYGDYEVIVRNARNHQSECLARRDVPYDLKAAAAPVRGKTLKWWAYSEDGECQRWPVPPGVYYIETKHCWRRFWWVRRACNELTKSNTFEIHPAGLREP